MTTNDRENKRLESLKETKKQLLIMLGPDKPSYTQESILLNIDKAITEKELLINQRAL